MTEGLADTIENPLTGEQVTFLITAEENNSEYVRNRNETSASAPGVPRTTTSLHGDFRGAQGKRRRVRRHQGEPPSARRGRICFRAAGHLAPLLELEHRAGDVDLPEPYKGEAHAVAEPQPPI